MKRHPQILDKDHTALMVIDIQKKINAVMQAGDLVVASAVKLIRASQILDIPILLTEQYPQGLGPTEEVILRTLNGTRPIQKMTFSCCGSKDVLNQLIDCGARQVVLTGIECHVCVQQTALDLLAHDFQVHIPVDAVSSRKALDCEVAIKRMARAGGIITTVEGVLFELLRQAGTANFKEVTRLIK